MVSLEKKNYHPRDDLILFNNSRHAYSTKRCPYLRSVTKVVYSQFPAFDKIKVSKKIENKKQYTGMNASEIRKMWEVNGKEARDAGTLLHAQIENYYNGEEVEADESDVALDQFLEWDAAHEDWVPYRTEWKIFDADLKIAGTIDAVFKDENGQFVMVDWKRCKEIKKNNRFDSASGTGLEHIPDCNFAKYSMQLNLYKLMLENNYGLSVSRMIIANFHPDQSSFHELEAMDMNKELQLVFSSPVATALRAEGNLRSAEGTALRAEGKRGGGGVLTELKSGKEIKITGTFILSQINEQ